MTAEFIQNDWRQADLTPAERVMLEYSEKLTVSPDMMDQQDIRQLRDEGWTNRDVLDIASVCAYFNYRVRIVDGLGLEVSDQAAERATEARDQAETLAQERGVSLPTEIWGVTEEAKSKAAT